MDEDRAHAALHRQPLVAAAGVVADAVLGHAGGVGIEQGRGLVVAQELHDVLHEVALQGSVGLDHQHLRMEGGDQAQLLAVFVLADMGDTEAGQIRVLGREAGGRCLATGIGVGAGVQDHDLERGVSDQQPGQGAEADVVHGPVATEGDDGRHQGELFLGVLLPIQGVEEGIVGLWVVLIHQVQLGGAQGSEVLDRTGAQTLEDSLGQGHRILEQAVHPGVRVGVVREGRGVDAAAAGGIGDHGPGRTTAGQAALETVQAPLQDVDGLLHARQAIRVLLVVTDFLDLRRQAVDQVTQLLDVGPALGLVDRAIGRHQHAQGGHLPAAAASAVPADHGVVVVAVQDQALGIAARLGRVLPEAYWRVAGLAEELELDLQ